MSAPMELPADMECRYCGCTREQACALPDGSACFWSWPGLCSTCLAQAVMLTSGMSPSVATTP